MHILIVLLTMWCRSGNLIGVVGVDIAVSSLATYLDTYLLTDTSQSALVRFEDGIVVADTLNETRSSTLSNPVYVSDLGIMSVDGYEAVSDAVEMNGYKYTAALLNFTVQSDHGITTSFPVPIPTDKRNPNFIPTFLIVQFVSNSVFDVVSEIGKSIDDDIVRVALLCVGLGLVGMIVLISIVWCFARMLTQPLLWIESAAWRIVNHNTEQHGEDPQVDKLGSEKVPIALRCAPKTEIQDIVAEFRLMIKGFSGDGAAKVADKTLHEIENDLTWHSEFHKLYSRQAKKRPRVGGSLLSENTDEDSRDPSAEARGVLARVTPQDVTTLSQSSVPGALSEPGAPGQAGTLIVPAPVKRNRGQLVCTEDNADPTEDRYVLAYRSSLFWWIGVLIVVPLLLTNTVICTVVSTNIMTTIFHWLRNTDDASFNLELSTLKKSAESKAELLTTLMHEHVRDSHFIARTTEWLLFDAVPRSEAFLNAESPTEECSLSPSAAQCPFNTDDNRSPCPCEWHDISITQCTVSNTTFARYAEKMFFGVQAHDMDLTTGDRDRARMYPVFDYSPNTTLWHQNVSSMPGSAKGTNASGYTTLYDRVRVSSAMAIVHLPIYNYAASLGQQKTVWGTYVAFEADGLFFGGNGCSYTNAGMAFWVADEGAFKTAPRLCPLGRYGYDPRCRDWFAEGKRRYLDKGTPFYVTAPYSFAIEKTMGTSATAPLVDPRTGQYVGQTLLDFVPFGIREALTNFAGTTYIVITPEADGNGDNTVVGPDANADWVAAPIGDLLFNVSNTDPSYRTYFDSKVLPLMKNGTFATVEFDRPANDGGSERLVMAVAPVRARVLKSLASDDFSRGVEVSTTHLYSVGVMRSQYTMHSPFDQAAAEVESQLGKLQMIYIISTVLISLAFVVFSCIVSDTVEISMYFRRLF
jgi:hypothetical protein